MWVVGLQVSTAHELKEALYLAPMGVKVWRGIFANLPCSVRIPKFHVVGVCHLRHNRCTQKGTNAQRAQCQIKAVCAF